MPLDMQVKLLRVLQEGEFTRVGSTEIRRTDVRIIATSNCDVQKAIAEEKFRQDLFFRLDVISVRIPPLRERKDDIPFLCNHFVKKYSEKYSKNVTEVDEEVIAHFSNYNWPGNVRELENVIQRSVLSCREGGRIKKTHLPDHWLEANQKKSLHSALSEDLSINEMEKRLISSTLQRHNNHKTKTAEILGITLKTLRTKILQYRLELENDSE